jgi:hypothetical protein
MVQWAPASGTVYFLQWRRIRMVASLPGGPSACSSRSCVGGSFDGPALGYIGVIEMSRL